MTEYQRITDWKELRDLLEIKEPVKTWEEYEEKKGNDGQD